MKPVLQRSMHCPCGRARILAGGLCATCYTLKRQARAYFGGLREQVLARDGPRCLAYGKPGRQKRACCPSSPARRPGARVADHAPPRLPCARFGPRIARPPAREFETSHRAALWCLRRGTWKPVRP